ncbi:MAG: glycosyltransferase [Acidithiobacillus caldus]|uniref:glycosyltransferase n=1 Tax=Acidithiobacillus caldus TaxID=33059 RepID=UPI00281598A7|nr:glycosyltransferase [Acidithiobacillus caldus]WMT47189.1 MAG: glycosyltransferase [Acidithiobacillus caldus]
MRIVIDLQGAQSASRHRGIGRYSLQFATALARNGKRHEIFIALNAVFADTIEPIRAAFAGLLPPERIVVWEAPGPVSGMDPANTQRRRAAERVREAFLASLRPDWVVVTSLFEGLIDDTVTSIGRQVQLPTAVVLYDLIPLIYRDVYLRDPVTERWYLEKLDHLRRADRLLSISETAGREAVDHLGFDSAAVTPIGTDCHARFRRMELTEAQRTHLRAAYGIERPFVLSFGGPYPDWRKNLDRLISAYGLLPPALRRDLQLVIVTLPQPGEGERLHHLAREAGLNEDELVLTGVVPDDDLLALYNACTLFVFPSWHEGFGLPVLEAMRCGKAVLAANTSSLPEVVGRQDALFDPFDEGAMAALIARALGDEAWRQELAQHALEYSQRFSWDATAQRALAALNAARPASASPVPRPGRRPRLAYVSPLPPERSGIADYSAELLPELTRWYEVEAIVAQPEVTDAAIRATCPIRSVEEFRARSARYDRVLYHFGKSPFHEHMFALLEQIPGVVVLHDFFLSGIQVHSEGHGLRPHAWARALQEGHGYRAVRERYTEADVWNGAVWRYPANLPVLQKALGVIVHSAFSRTLADQWYGEDAAADWAVIPHLRTPASAAGPKAARQALGLAEDALLVCSFGLLGPHKLNDRLLEAWLASPLAADPKAHLVFVGQNDGSDYGQTLLRRIRESAGAERIRITGWADVETYRRYLAAADIAVQLRAHSRGETSGTVLDCMNVGLPTIVNAHGSLADLDRDGVWMLPDEFSDAQLIEALAVLAGDAERRQRLGGRAQEIVRTRHAPRRCAEQYVEAIEKIYQHAAAGLPGLLHCFAHDAPPEADWSRLAGSLARSFPPAPRRRQLLVDVSLLAHHDLRTGIQRVVRAILREWLDNPPEGLQVEPVYATGDAPGYRYARRFTCRFLGIPDHWAEDAPVEAWAGDVFVGLDFLPHVVPAQQAFLQRWRDRGVQVWFVVYDLLPILLPQVFPEDAQALHQRWLETISRFDGVVAISRAVADELVDWLQTFGPKRERPLSIDWFHLGADTENSVPTTGLPADAEEVLARLSSRPSFLMVGTIEPRKGYLQTLQAFDALWTQGIDVNLVIVGQEGWKPVPHEQRRDIPQTIQALRYHAERGNRLFWLEGISDEYLEKVYAASTCLIAASYGEGFGLPLIEATQHKLPIIARDIPVFREVAGEYAFFFADARDPAVIAAAVRAWLDLHRAGTAPASHAMPWLTWRQSAKRLLDIVLGQAAPYRSWLPDGVRRYWGNDPRLHTQVGERVGREMRTTGKAGFLLYGPYERLEPGRYRVVLTGESEHWSGEEWLDVVCDKGKIRLFHSDVGAKSFGAWHHVFDFKLNQVTSDLEIRIWVNEKSCITISSLKIITINSQQVGIVVVTYGILPTLLVDSVNSRYSVKWYIYHHGSEKLNNSLKELFDGKRSELHLLCENRGLSKSWNDGISRSLLDGNVATVVINDDIEFNSLSFDSWIEFILNSKQDGLVFINGEEPQSDGSSIIRSEDFACYGIGLSAINKVGAFDENFVPAYYEDFDYIVRCDKMGVPVLVDERVGCRHARSSTSKNNPEIAAILPELVEKNRIYMVKKWGGDAPHLVSYSTPFDDEKRSVFTIFKGLI